jgi:O-methyltransferase domain
VPDLAPPRPLARAVLGARVALERLGDRLLPAEVAALNRSIGFAPAFTMRALAELDVPEALGGRRRSAREIATEKGLDADALHRVMRYAALHGLLKLDRRGRFRLTRTGRVLLADHPHSMRPWILYLTERSTQEAWAGVTETIRTGEPSFPATHGESVWSYFEKHPREEAQFAAGMRRITEIDLPSIVAGYPWPDNGTVCDVAGGIGTLLTGVLKARPGLRGVLVDAPGVLREAEDHLRRNGVHDRVELSEGNFFESIVAQADVYVMKDVLHDWDDERCRTILRTVRAAMPPQSKLVLVETLQEPNAVEPVASFVDVHMLTQTDGGRQRSVAELHALLRDAGLEPGQVTRTANPALVEAIASGSPPT